MMVVLALGLAGQVRAQDDAITKYFDKYVNDEANFDYFTFSGKMFQMISKLELDDSADQKLLEESIGKVKGVKVITGKSGRVDGVKHYKEVLGLIKGKGFEELMSARDEDKDIKFYIKEKGNKIDEMFMVIGGSKEFTMLSVFGDGIDLNMLYKLSKRVGIDAFDEFGRLEKSGGN